MGNTNQVAVDTAESDRNKLIRVSSLPDRARDPRNTSAERMTDECRRRHTQLFFDDVAMLEFPGWKDRRNRQRLEKNAKANVQH